MNDAPCRCPSPRPIVQKTLAAVEMPGWLPGRP